MNSPCQPPTAMTSGAKMPAAARPSGMPAETTAMIVARSRSGASSAESALTLGKTAPNAMPVSRRQTRNSVIVLYMGDAADDGGPPVMAAKSPLVGTFTDRLVRTPEGWRFAERVGGLDFRP